MKGKAQNYSQQLHDLTSAVYSSTKPLSFAEAAAACCYPTSKQTVEVMAERRLPRLVRMTQGLIVRDGKGQHAQFRRGTEMSKTSAMTRVSTL